MKPLVLFSSLIAFIITGCASQKGTKEDYFGYNNSPTINESTDKPTVTSKPKRSAPPTDSAITLSDPPKDDWVNPMAQDDDPQEDYQDDAVQPVTTVGYQPYSSPQYVPVVVPWWDSYSGWMGGYYSRPVVVVRYPNWYWGWNSYCDWYSPYYSHHPWYGGYFSHYRPRYYGWNHNYWRPWHHYPIYNYGHTNPVPRKPNSVRSWGPSRGESSATPVGVRGTVTTSNPTSSTPAVRNERGQGLGTPQAKTTTNTSPTIRNERGNSNTSPQQPQDQHPLKRSETTPASNSPKAITAPNASVAPVRQERATKDATPTPRSESKTPSTATPTPRNERQTPTQAPRNVTTPSPSSSTPSSTTPRGTRKP